jgi:hypothetical protein
LRGIMAALLDSYQPVDLKLIYRVLHRHLLEEHELLDSIFFHDLQTYLQQRARAEHVDLADHAQWDAWLRSS